MSKLFPFIVPIFLFIVAAALHYRESAAELETQLREERARRASLAASIDGYLQQIEALEAARQSTQQKTRKVLRHDPPSQSWASQPLPDAVRMLISDSTSPTGSTCSSDSPACSAVPRDDE